MILFALALASAHAQSVLDVALASYERLATEAAATGNRDWMPAAATTVCRAAFADTIARNDMAAVDRVIAYRGPDADRLRLSCSLYFQARAR